MKLRMKLGFVAGVLIIAAGLVWMIRVRPLLIAGEQLRNGANLRIYFVMVEDYHKEHGVMPETLSQAVPETFGQRAFWLATRDTYGHPLHYEVRRDHFLIASYGRDGIRDERPYAHEGDDPSRIAVPCRDPDADTVISSDGVFQACTK